MAGKGESDIAKTQNFNGNGLVLYSYQHCYYSQKVLMALYEKNIPFTKKDVNIAKDEQYKPWFLKINSEGKIPVLKDGIKYIPGSERIICYIEDNFSNGEYSRLVPIQQGPELKKKIETFNSSINSISGYDITVGPLINHELSCNWRYPFIFSFIRNSVKNSIHASSTNIKEYAFCHKQFTEILLERAANQSSKFISIYDRVTYLKVLEKVGKVLDDVENELQQHGEDKSEWWLCTDRFTVADISLTVLLDRLAKVGLEEYFWGSGKRPRIKMYFDRVQERISYKKTMPTLMTDLSQALRSGAPLIIGISLIAVAVGGLLYFK